MRNLLPKTEYCRLKNRKCSRLERAKHSNQAKGFETLEINNSNKKDRLKASTKQIEVILALIAAKAPQLTGTMQYELKRIEEAFGEAQLPNKRVKLGEKSLEHFTVFKAGQKQKNS